MHPKSAVTLFFCLCAVTITLSSCSGSQIRQTEKAIEIGSGVSPKQCFTAPEGDEVVIVDGNIDGNMLGDYDVTVATKNNPNKSKKFTISVVDTRPPEVVVGENGRITLEQNNANYKIEDYFTVRDNDRSHQCTIEMDDSAIDITVEGVYTVSYKATDYSGNTSEGTVLVEVAEPWEDYEEAAVELIKSLKAVLKNPESLQVHSIGCCKHSRDDNDYYYKIDFSAQNGFGGMNRETFYFHTSDGKVDDYDFDTTIMAIAQVMYGGYHAFRESLDVAKITAEAG